MSRRKSQRPRARVRYECPNHPGRLMVCLACQGQRGGRKATTAKATAAAQNWQKALAGISAARARLRAAREELSQLEP